MLVVKTANSFMLYIVYSTFLNAVLLFGVAWLNHTLVFGVRI